MKKLILTDIDGTLTRKSLVLSHAGFLIEKGLIKDDGSFKAWEQDMKNESLIVSVAENYRHELVGKTEKELETLEFFESFYQDKNNWYMELIEKLQAVKDDKETDVVLVSGSSDFLVSKLAEKLNADFYATTYQKDDSQKYTGSIIGMFSEPQKDDCIQWNVNINEYDYVEAWGDTSSDYGLFKHADFKILVEPTRQTLEYLITRTQIDRII